MKPSRRALAVAAVLAGLVPGTRAGEAQAPPGCGNPDALGLARTVEIDASKGRLYGSVTTYPSFELLRDKEVVLTFDDGPYPGLTAQVLAALERECTKATFFVVGQMAANSPHMVRTILARGHTVGTHTLTHPLGTRRMPFEAVREEIDRGFAAAHRVAPGRIAPFFRFPGLGDSADTLAYLKSRGIATFTVDLISNDSFIRDPDKLVRRTMNILAERGKGIILMHDIKASTAQALPLLLQELKKGGYRVVHVTAKVPYSPGRATPAPLVAERSAPPAVPETAIAPRTVPLTSANTNRNSLSPPPAQSSPPRVETPPAIEVPPPPLPAPRPVPSPARQREDWRQSIFERNG